MGDDSVVECLIRSASNQIQFQHSFNLGYTNRVVSKPYGITEILASYTDGVLRCRWRRIRHTSIDRADYDLLTGKYYILLAQGDLRQGSEKEKHEFRVSTSNVVNLAAAGAVSGSDMRFLIRIHGIILTG